MPFKKGQKPPKKGATTKKEEKVSVDSDVFDEAKAAMPKEEPKKANEPSVEETLVKNEEKAMTKELYRQLQEMQRRLDSLQANPQGQSSNIDISEIVRAARGGDEFSGYYAENEIDEEDFDEKGTTFFASKSGYVIVDDVRFGRPVKAPLGRPIVFTYQATKQVKSGKEIEIYNFCSYTSHSKKETEWLRNYTYYNTIIFENPKNALDASTDIGSKIADYINLYKSQDAVVVANQLRDYGLTITPNASTNRITLAEFMAKRERQNEIEAAERRASQILKENELLTEETRAGIHAPTK